MQTYRGAGSVIYPLVPSGGVVSGNAYLVSHAFGIAGMTVAYVSGAVFPMHVEGRYAISKKSGDTFAVGDYAYWDSTNTYVTSTSSGNTKIGVATAVAVGGDASVEVRLNEAF